MVKITKPGRVRVFSRRGRWDNTTRGVVKEFDQSFEDTNLLPTHEATVALVTKTLNGTPGREITKFRVIWLKHRRSLLSDAEYDVHIACDIFFEKMLAVPTAGGLFAKLKGSQAANLSASEVDALILNWRYLKFAYELAWAEYAVNDSVFNILLLRPDLANWYPLLRAYQRSVVTKTARRHVLMGVRDFFYGYLARMSIPREPKIFLSVKNIAPNIKEILYKDVSAAHSRRMSEAINNFLSWVINFGSGFANVDKHEHITRSKMYHNPLLPNGAEAGITGLPTDRLTERTGWRIPKGAKGDVTFGHFDLVNPALRFWRDWGAEWLKEQNGNLQRCLSAINKFVLDYLIPQRLPMDPKVFLSSEWQAKNNPASIYDICFKQMTSRHGGSCYQKVIDFINWVLVNHFSVEDDHYRKIVPPEFRNPFDENAYEKTYRGNGRLSKSNKRVLPARYVKVLGDILIPPGAASFGDLKWAIENSSEGEWFSVPPDMVDPDDPNCVWREKLISTAPFAEDGTQVRRTNEKAIQLWIPVRAMAAMAKTELPLRTYQVRMLDSGEADVWRYEGSSVKWEGSEWRYKAGHWVENRSDLTKSLDREWAKRNAGVFRRMPTASGGMGIGLFINTNKTRDIGKEEWDRGYEVPWTHKKLLYWLEQLRNWQEKYNPITELTSCMRLTPTILGQMKSYEELQNMGARCFLFRDPARLGDDASLPITNSNIEVVWVRMLKKLEDICEERGDRAEDGTKLRFAPEVNSGATEPWFPLHSLRVSLLTHYATEGGVEMKILSECIAGHARLLMTYYYKKSGVTYVSEKMDEASKRIEDSTAENYLRWLKDATLDQLKVNGAYVEMSALEAVKDASVHGGVALVRSDKGLCGKGAQGCDTGGIHIDETNGKVSFGPVPGYPQKNCTSCRWFYTGPAFLPGLINHWNTIHLNLGELGSQVLNLGKEVQELENAQYDCKKTGIAFPHHARLTEARQAYADCFDGNEKLAGDSMATLRLIVRCQHIIEQAKIPDSGIDLIAVGGVDELAVSVKECGQLEQLLHAVVRSTVHIEPNIGNATLRLGSALDRMLAMNDRKPVFFKLSERELSQTVVQMTKLLQAQSGSLANSVSVIEGIKTLEEIGWKYEMDQLLEINSAGLALEVSTLVSKRSSTLLGGADSTRPSMVSA